MSNWIPGCPPDESRKVLIQMKGGNIVAEIASQWCRQVMYVEAWQELPICYVPPKELPRHLKKNHWALLSTNEAHNVPSDGERRLATKEELAAAGFDTTGLAEDGSERLVPESEAAKLREELESAKADLHSCPTCGVNCKQCQCVENELKQLRSQLAAKDDAGRIKEILMGHFGLAWQGHTKLDQCAKQIIDAREQPAEPKQQTLHVGPYKGYYGKAEYDSDGGFYHGEAIGVNGVVTFVGNDLESLQKEFAASIDDYLSFCTTPEPKWRAARAGDEGKPCRVRDEVDDKWIPDKKLLDVGEYFLAKSLIGTQYAWRYCEVEVK